MSTITIPAPAAIRFRRPYPDIPAEQRIAIRDIAWDLYDRLSDAIGEGQNVHLAYDGSRERQFRYSNGENRFVGYKAKIEFNVVLSEMDKVDPLLRFRRLRLTGSWV
jgi:hypothetical protein